MDLAEVWAVAQTPGAGGSCFRGVVSAMLPGPRPGGARWLGTEDGSYVHFRLLCESLK